MSKAARQKMRRRKRKEVRTAVLHREPTVKEVKHYEATLDKHRKQLDANLAREYKLAIAFCEAGGNIYEA